MKIETDRLIIRRLNTKDGRAMKEILTDFENSPAAVYDYRRPTDSEKIDMLMPIWVKNSRYYIISEKDSGKSIGFICIDKSADVGFNIHSAYHRKGYGYEAVSAFINYMRTKKHIKIFTAQAAVENTASVKLLEKLGFSETGREYIRFRQNRPEYECIKFKLIK